MRLILVALLITVGAPIVAVRPTAAAQQPGSSAPLRTEVPLALAGCTPADETAYAPVAPSPSVVRPSTHQTKLKILRRGGAGVPIAGRLIPTTNIAAQAGSLDQTVPATAIVAGEQNRIPVPQYRASPVQIFVPPPSRGGCAAR